jgi:hypothetical protein
VGAELRPRNHWRSIALEYLEGAPALTEMGKLEQAFFGERAANA